MRRRLGIARVHAEVRVRGTRSDEGAEYEMRTLEIRSGMLDADEQQLVGTHPLFEARDLRYLSKTKIAREDGARRP
jgi:hypothetical protein